MQHSIWSIWPKAECCTLHKLSVRTIMLCILVGWVMGWKIRQVMTAELGATRTYAMHHPVISHIHKVVGQTRRSRHSVMPSIPGI